MCYVVVGRCVMLLWVGVLCGCGWVNEGGVVEEGDQ